MSDFSKIDSAYKFEFAIDFFKIMRTSVKYVFQKEKRHASHMRDK